MPPRIRHIAFKVEDAEGESAFYQQVFGYRETRTVRHEGRGGGHISHHLSDGLTDLTLLQYDGEHSEQADFSGPAPCIHHIGIEVEDLDAFVAAVRANAGEILSAPGTLPVKFRSPRGPVCEVAPIGRWHALPTPRDKHRNDS
jgi:catechol 2,3-dioxygenase-like lactoylglutathione lyase family enzyme